MRIAIIDAGPQSAKLAAVIAGEFGRAAAARALYSVTDARTAAVFMSPLSIAIDEQLDREYRRLDFQKRIGLDKLYRVQDWLERLDRANERAEHVRRIARGNFPGYLGYFRDRA